MTSARSASSVVRRRQPLSSTLYDEEYFLTSCEGYQEFLDREGRQLSRRLAASFAIAEVRPGIKVLDIGSGRGEIVRHCARLGADAYGLDYSAVASDEGGNAAMALYIGSKKVGPGLHPIEQGISGY